MDLRSVQALSLAKSFYKKLEPSGRISEQAESAALKKFLAINDSIAPAFTFKGSLPVDDYLWDLFRDNLLKVLDWTPEPGVRNFDLDFIREEIAIGPGSSSKVDSTCFYTKLFGGDLSATSEYLLALYRAAIVETGLWADAEHHRSSKFGLRIADGNVLFFVPKTTEIARTCCTEPILNMLFQKAAGAFLEYRLKRHFGISLDVQPDYNRKLAMQGSVDGSFGTIDLVSASDSISWSLCQKVLPNSLLGFLRHFRASSTVLPDGSTKELRMISTMGNGFTFALQTVLFACAVRSVYQSMGYPTDCPRTQFGVFGDDIIVRREAYERVCHLVRCLGFEVNEGKSFNTGPFRESCGEDYFGGHNVRGVYIRSLETVSDVYSAINRLNRWSARTGIFLPKTVSLLVGMVRFLPIPFQEGDHEGIKVPFMATIPEVDNRYWFRFRKRANRNSRILCPDSPQAAKDLGYKDFNPYGWGLSFLGGYTRSEELGVYPETLTDGNRLKDRQWWTSVRLPPGAPIPTKVVRKSVPFWDWPGPVALIGYSYSGWKTAVAANLARG
jgi:hypothetical protein